MTLSAAENRFYREVPSREIIPITSEAQWLELRSQDLTSTQISALYGVNPYCTKFELYHAHKSGLRLPFEETERTRKGKKIEAYAAEVVAEYYKATVKKLDLYARIPGARFGSSFDYELTMPDGELVLLELKAVDYFQHKAKWLDEEAPEYIEIQLQHQLECVDKYERGIIAAFTSLYDFIPYERDRDRVMGSALRASAALFWLDITEGREPPIDFYRDGDVVAMLYRDAGGAPIDKTGDDYLEALIAKHVRLGQEIKSMDEERDAAKVEIHRYLENAAGAYTDRFKVTTGWTKGSEGTIVTTDMVGQKINARAPYRQCLTKNLMSNSKSKGERL